MAQLNIIIERLRSQRFLHFLSTGLGLVFLLLAAWLLAQLTWRMLLPADQVILPKLQATQTEHSAVAKVDIGRVQQLNLFGKKGAVEAQVRPKEAPVTSLNIRLVGVAASTNPNKSAAIIQQGSSQSTYIPGDTISNSRAVVKEILSDRVMLENNSQLETLWLEGRDGSEAPLMIQTESTEQEPAEPEQNGEAVLQEEITLSSSQKDFLQIVSITPQQGDDGLIGYRLAPKSDEALFRQFGLFPGDLAVAINGYDLTNLVESMELMATLEGLKQAQVRILRDGEYVDIEIYIPEE